MTICLSARAAVVVRRPSCARMMRSDINSGRRTDFGGRLQMFDYVAIMAIMRTMGTEKASVALAKNTLSSLINKVAYGKTRVVLESRGKPKAALISTEDLERLEHLEQRDASPQNRLKILVQAQALRGKIRRRRKKILPNSADRLNQLREQRDRGI